MKNIKIGPKLIISFIFLAAITASLGIYTIEALKEMKKEDTILYEKAIVPLGFLSETGYLAQEMRVQAREWRLAKTDEAREAALKTMDSLRIELGGLIEQQKERVIKEAGKKPLDELLAIVGKFNDEMHEFAKNHTVRCPLSGMTTADYTPSLLNAGAEMKKAFNTTKDMRTSNAKVIFMENSQTVDNSIGLSINFLIAALIISIGLGVFLTLSITRPLHAVVDVLYKMEKGDMTVRANLERKDELGMLSKALDSLSAKLQTIFRNLQLSSNTLAGSAEELSGIGRQVTAATEQMNSNINAMASGAEQASTNTNDVAGTAEQMSTNVNTMAAAVEELSASIRQISNNASDTRKVASEATAKSENATSVMNKLRAAAKEIGHVTEVIKRIADKTSLLALNATIEAASAGEAGKGFTVVAGEIKELANQSTISADDISRRIESIQSSASESVAVINDVAEIITKINQSVDVISSHVDQQTKASNEISNNVLQVNVGAKRVSSAIGEVAKGSKDMSRAAAEVAKNSISAENTKQINQGADELARMASDLKGVLGHFKV